MTDGAKLLLSRISPQEYTILVRFKETDLLLPYWKKLAKKYGFIIVAKPKEKSNDENPLTPA